MEDNKFILFQELESERKRYSDTLDKVVENAKEFENRIRSAEETRNQLEWYLGEARAKNQDLTDQLSEKNQVLDKMRQEQDELRRLYDESQWYLGEERNRRGQLEHDLRQCASRCEALEAQLNQIHAQLDTVQKNLNEAQWFLGEERAKHSS